MGNMRTPRSTAELQASGRGSLGLLVGLIAVCLLLSATPAQGQTNKDASDKLVELNKKALMSIDGKRFDEARDNLEEAVAVAKRANLLSHKMLARTYIHLGAVYFLGFGDRKNACKYFGLAKTIRSDIKLTPSLAIATLTDLFEKTSADGKDPDPKADKGTAVRRPSTGGATTPATPTVEPVDATVPTVPAGVIPELPALLPTDLYCPIVEEANEGHEIVLRCAAKPSLKAERILLYYRVSGGMSYTAAAMQTSDKGWLAATIPAEAATGESMQYYCEAQDSNDNVVATSGQQDLPNPIMLKPDTGAAAVAQVQGQNQGEDPLEKYKKKIEDDLYEQGLHRRRKGAFWLGLGMGTGYGYHLGSNLEWRRDADPVKKGTRFAGLITGYPEIGYLITDHFGMAVQGRIEYIPISGYGDPTKGRPANGAYSVIGRGLYYLDLGAGNAQLQFSADFGGGNGYRFAYPPTNPNHTIPVMLPDGKCQVVGGECVQKPTLLTDTTRSGPIVYGASVGFLYHFNRHIAANVELRFLGAGPHLGLLGEGYASIQFALGGARPGQEDEVSSERLPEEDEAEE
jgi:hypothetical protein